VGLYVHCTTAEHLACLLLISWLDAWCLLGAALLLMADIDKTGECTLQLPNDS